MALLQECPQCRMRSSLRETVEVKVGDVVKVRERERAVCPGCGFKLAKASGKVYWIEWYIDGRRKRKRIGSSKEAAEHHLRDILKARTEERYIEKDKAAKMSLGELCTWYLKLPEVKAKDSYDRDEDYVANLKRLLGEKTKIKDVTTGVIEGYQTQRLQEKSSAHPGQTIKPCTVNKEVSCLKWIINRAIRHRKLQHNPANGVKRLAENNVRMRVLTPDEFKALVNACDDHLKPVVTMAYYMGMRRDEIVRLTWPEVDLKKGFVRLPPERTKTDAGRNIPIHPEVKVILEKLPRAIHTDRVFLRYGQPFDEIKHSFQTACKGAKIENFTFHDLRHCALNNLRKAGNDYFKIMALSGHKTISVFKRYNLVTEEELSGIKWQEKGGNAGAMDTSVDTRRKKEVSQDG
jgi:integrase